MDNCDANKKSDDSTGIRFAWFGPIDRLDWLIILLAVLLGTLAKQRHFRGLPVWFLDWAMPFLLIVAGYKIRRTIAEVIRKHHKQEKE